MGRSDPPRKSDPLHREAQSAGVKSWPQTITSDWMFDAMLNGMFDETLDRVFDRMFDVDGMFDGMFDGRQSLRLTTTAPSGNSMASSDVASCEK